MDRIAELPLVKRNTTHSVTYLHAGFPRAIDGVNQLEPDTKLLYVGKAAGKNFQGATKEVRLVSSPATRVIAYMTRLTA